MVAVGWGLEQERAETLPSKLQQVTLRTIRHQDDKCKDTVIDASLQFCAFAKGKGTFTPFCCTLPGAILSSFKTLVKATLVVL